MSKDIIKNNIRDVSRDDIKVVVPDDIIIVNSCLYHSCHA